jgi:hypothetical protein
VSACIAFICCGTWNEMDNKRTIKSKPFTYILIYWCDYLKKIRRTESQQAFRKANHLLYWPEDSCLISAVKRHVDCNGLYAAHYPLPKQKQIIRFKNLDAFLSMQFKCRLYLERIPGPESSVYTLPPADISTEALYFLYTAPEFSNLCDV